MSKTAAVFNKKKFINDVTETVRHMYRKQLKEASQQEIFQAVSYVVKDVVIDDWLATQQAFDDQDPKIVYYMSMEFLMGRALGNNLINLKAYKEVKEALEEIHQGQKQSHWMWFIFPQIVGLGRSEIAQYYSIKNLQEAKDFLNDKLLGANLREISEALLKVESNDAEEVMGWPDDMKLKSSMTLFLEADSECEVFQKVLDKFFDGNNDQKTVEILEAQKRNK